MVDEENEDAHPRERQMAVENPKRYCPSSHYANISPASALATALYRSMASERLLATPLGMTSDTSASCVGSASFALDLREMTAELRR